MRTIGLLCILTLKAWGELRAGAAERDITPPAGAPLAGYYYNRAATGTHDPLHVKALVLESDGVRIALVTCDLTNLPESIASAARRQAGIPATHVMISATHTHTSPIVLGGFNRYNLSGEPKRMAEDYAARLPGIIAGAISDAVAHLQPARLSASIGNEASIAFNRRYWLKNGSVGWNPGKGNPEIVRPAGAVDPQIPLLYIEGVDGTPIAAYLNYAIHLDTIGGTEFSADLANPLSEALRAVKGKNFMTLFTMGCAGNVNHINVQSKVKQSGAGEAARIGTILAAAALKSMDRLEPVEDHRISARSEIVPLALRESTAAEQTQARATAATFGQTSAAPFLDLVKAARILEVAERKGVPLQAEVQVLRMGKDLAWVGLPGEVFVELGLQLKTQSPLRWTIVATQSNASLGYMPNRAAYAQGAYEVVSTRLAPGWAERLVERALAILSEGAKE